MTTLEEAVTSLLKPFAKDLGFKKNYGLIVLSYLSLQQHNVILRYRSNDVPSKKHV